MQFCFSSEFCNALIYNHAQVVKVVKKKKHKIKFFLIWKSFQLCLKCKRFSSFDEGSVAFSEWMNIKEKIIYSFHIETWSLTKSRRWTIKSLDNRKKRLTPWFPNRFYRKEKTISCLSNRDEWPISKFRFKLNPCCIEVTPRRLFLTRKFLTGL